MEVFDVQLADVGLSTIVLKTAGATPSKNFLVIEKIYGDKEGRRDRQAETETGEQSLSKLSFFLVTLVSHYTKCQVSPHLMIPVG